MMQVLSPPPPRKQIMTTDGRYPEVRFNEPSLIRTTEPESQPVEANETPAVKQLDGEAVRLGEIAFSGGTYCAISQTLPPKGSHGCTGIVTDIGPRPCMVSGTSYLRNTRSIQVP